MTTQIEWRAGYSVLINTPAGTAFAREVGIELRRIDGVVGQGTAQSGSENCAFMLGCVPGSYLLIGNGDGDRAGACMVTTVTSRYIWVPVEVFISVSNRMKFGT